MKLKRFDKQTVKAQSQGPATVYIHQSGPLSFNNAAIARMCIPEDGYVEIIQDEDAPSDWYVVLSTFEKGLKVHKEKGKNKNTINSGLIAKCLLNSIANDRKQPIDVPKTASLLIGAAAIEFDGEKLWPIITRSFKVK